MLHFGTEIQESAKESEKQRERLIELQRVNDVKRHELMDQENSLRTRETEMENSIIRAKQREVGIIFLYFFEKFNFAMIFHDK